jgi:hypothetical protein
LSLYKVFLEDLSIVTDGKIIAFSESIKA